MRIKYTNSFKDDYQALPAELQGLTDKKLLLLVAGFGSGKMHPSLRVKKIQGTTNPTIWELSVNMSIRATFSVQSDLVVLRRIGEHDKALKKP